MNKSERKIEIARLKSLICEAKNYLTSTDYITAKFSEALAVGDDTTELKTKYAKQLEKRKTYRSSIDQYEASLKPLEDEDKLERLEEEKTLSELRKQEELRQKEASDLLIKAKKEELEQIEKDRLEQEAENNKEADQAA